MARILAVDDEPKVRTLLSMLLSAHGHDVLVAENGREALDILSRDTVDLLITDIRMEGMDGLSLLQEVKEREPGCPVIFITAYATVESAVEALRLGASDYVVKPYEEKDLLLAVERALGVRRLLQENIRLRHALSAGAVEDAVFASPAMKNVQRTALKVAASDATVLITGESGVGKEVIARLIHQASPRHKSRFVAVNCAAVTPSLVESELFGHERGAFTGADRRREGKLEFANGGTLFLDEVGDLPLEVQAKLLRALQERRVQRIGGNQDIAVDVRVLCATNMDLEHAVAEGRFRKDLYYRLAVFPLHVPPLRERPEDILPLVVHFIQRYTRKPCAPTEAATPAALRLLKDYAWPGNVRELANVVERVMILRGGTPPITTDDLAFLRPEKPRRDVTDLVEFPPEGLDFDALMRRVVQLALDRAGGNQSRAARLLRLTRGRFRTLLKHLNHPTD
ncbi:sigma-54-dependent transcriptional regulator [Desulfosoma caldarium]|uniref:Two-component system NtrC family response regulator n=1 Tax=Desulfosoma caldarium TaxID=610254 RepID=A0A3N1VM89_9BACT|nr:sigma-54 dependent transcriptional regulator [Desulfosoma caldarium]ROR03169.1 two-component system NtrC family response regulator [Desulfosoma caldarium]